MQETHASMDVCAWTSLGGYPAFQCLFVCTGVSSTPWQDLRLGAKAHCSERRKECNTGQFAPVLIERGCSGSETERSLDTDDDIDEADPAQSEVQPPQ